MHVGLGLPIADPTVLPDWARRAEAGPFTTLGLLDRLVYDNPEPLVALALLAGATSRIKVQTEVLIAPLRDPALLAKQTATLDRMTGGRFVLGLGVGGRDDDHEASGTDIRTRGRRLDEQIGLMRRLWSGESYSDSCGPIGPAPHTPGGPELLFGGFQPAALDRVGRWGGGFLAAAAPSWAGGLFDTVRRSWRDHGRPGEPRIVAQVNVALGADSVIEDARTRMSAYYEFSGRAEFMVEGMLATPATIRTALTQFEDLGADEVMLYCYGRDPNQVDRLADTLG
ncbi:alkanesulfonate monooxygenase SsuD/methylene tetrahydromethanopterin reductase-like flavin-dependent oxidoreductase (luciferase family) [Nocardia transvalensis]|uniref:Alkanesulfonate monooxygenase SsuD/methylene tetrahydromethanopterin reductase-like flavin-dependent oxidoreductase (Luciferase family) n=1 Tax=Nocardia transvalensis TaxID=37333 RepID=A0A7W9PBP7_9NOCA|nr:LLM class flavin-dependent oxidoreductase [Nocardia transvalensis]MBB5912728.1 alkanesulfonate monooxygenase SsuD/methylene tetrahydromethanopterin reductase-like flavin-dependent oxidoreductase (luciferase family) [Nocardia transvalensis]